MTLIERYSSFRTYRATSKDLHAVPFDGQPIEEAKKSFRSACAIILWRCLPFAAGLSRTSAIVLLRTFSGYDKSVEEEIGGTAAFNGEMLEGVRSSHKDQS